MRRRFVHNVNNRYMPRAKPQNEALLFLPHHRPIFSRSFGDILTSTRTAGESSSSSPPSSAVSVLA